MKKKILIITTIILLLETWALACGNNWLIKNKNTNMILCPDGTVSIDVCHKKKVITIEWEGWIKGHKKHGDTLGDCNKKEEPITPEADWTINTYEAYGTRPVMVERAIDPDYGTRWDKLSDGSYTIFTNNEDGQVVKTVNTEWGVQHEFTYYENGKLKYDVSHESWEDYSKPYDYYVDTYTESGLPDTHISKTRTGEIIVNRFTETGYIRGTESTQVEKDLYNQYFK